MSLALAWAKLIEGDRLMTNTAASQTGGGGVWGEKKPWATRRRESKHFSLSRVRNEFIICGIRNNLYFTTRNRLISLVLEISSELFNSLRNTRISAVEENGEDSQRNRDYISETCSAWITVSWTWKGGQTPHIYPLMSEMLLLRNLVAYPCNTPKDKTQHLWSEAPHNVGKRVSVVKSPARFNPKALQSLFCHTSPARMVRMVRPHQSMMDNLNSKWCFATFKQR